MRLSLLDSWYADAPIDDFLQVLLRFYEVTRRQDLYRFGFLDALDDLDVIEIGYSRTYPADRCLAITVHDDPEIAAEAIVRHPSTVGRTLPLQ